MVKYMFACVVRPEYRIAYPNTKYYSAETPGLIIVEKELADIDKAKQYAIRLFDTKTHNIYKYAHVNIYRKTSPTKELLVGTVDCKYGPIKKYRYLSASGSRWADWVELKKEYRGYY